jgi:Tfp pilus assembly protein PilF
LATQRTLTRDRKGDTDVAMKDYDEALRLEPGMIDALVHRAALREAKGERRKAKGESDGAKADLIAMEAATTRS